MAIDPKHLLAVGGIAVVALGAGFGVARATGGQEKAKPAAAARQAELPAVAAGSSSVPVVTLGDVAALPARRAAQRPRKSTGGSDGDARPGASATPSGPATTPVPNQSAAPPTSTPAPNTPQRTPQPPVRTPVVGGGTGGEDP